MTTINTTLEPKPISGHVFDLLRQYRDSDTRANWVLATVVTKYRSSYRQPGAMMLVSPLGQTLGLISGGCLEADILLQARKVQELSRPVCVVYDSTEEDNIAFELGLGCNGRVEVLIQELGAEHRAVLLAMLRRMETSQSSYLLHCFASDNVADMNQLVLLDAHMELVAAASSGTIPPLDDATSARHQVIADQGQRWSVSLHKPPTDLWVFGGGIDARPVVKIAALLGWRVTLVDHRLTHARERDFLDAHRIIRQPPSHINLGIDADAAILMSHNLNTDAAWLSRLQQCESLRYVGLLGPIDRKREAVELAGINPLSNFAQSIHGPMGFDIGGDLPESVALSVLAQCHQVLFKAELAHHP